jgi:WD40 repeat protein
MQTIQLIF